MNKHLHAFETFLKTIDLTLYREKYNPIKIVEMDLPKDVQAIELMYKVYWDEKRFIDFEHFYQEYLAAQGTAIETFRTKTIMCEDCFGRGLPARIYRTWASIITQIHAGYVAEDVYGIGSVAMSEMLDHNGADFQVTYKGHVVNYQVKKTTFSREVRQDKIAKYKIPGEFITINYEVPNFEHILQPRHKDGIGYYADYLRFKKEQLDPDNLKVLDNGFVIFTPKRFELYKQTLDKLPAVIAI